MPNFFINVKEKGAKKAKKNVRGLTGAMRGLASSAMAVAGPIMLIGAAYKAISGSIRVGRDFEQSMANLKAVTGATVPQFVALESMAKKLGGSTKFTASAVAGLATEYGKLGFTSKEILNVAEDTLFLAGAIGAELPRAAEVAGATLKGFGISATDTGRVTNLMAASFSGSALDMEKFAESMKVLAPIAKGAGFSIEDTTALIGTLANVGIHGSLAGTGLKNVFLQMSKEGSALSEALGGPITTIEEMAPAMMKLKEQGLSLSDAMGMVGKISAPAFLALVDGADKMQGLKKEFTGTNKAQEMYLIQQDTLKGRTDELTSATEALGIELFSTSEGGMKKAVEGLTGLATGAKNALIGLKKIDFKATFANIMGNIQLLGMAIKDTFAIYFDLLPDLFRFAFTKIYPIVMKLVDGLKAIGKVLWEPISVGLEIVSGKIKNVFINMFNFLKEQFNTLADTWVGSKMGMTPLEMTDLVDVEGLSVANTTIGQFFAQAGEDNIQTLSDFQAAADEIWTKYAEQVIVANESVKSELGEDENGNPKIAGMLDQSQVVVQQGLWSKMTTMWKDKDGKLVASSEDQKKEMKNQAKAFGKNIQTMAKAYPEMEKAGKRAAQVQALVDTYASATAAYKAMAGIPVVGPALGVAAAAAAIGAGMANVKMIEKAATGADFVTSGPQMLMVGDNPSGMERVSVTPLGGDPNINGPQGGGGSVTVNVSGNVLSQDFVEGELAENI